MSYCFSYSPLLTRFNTVKPAFFASEIESGLSFVGEVKLEMTLRTGFLQAGHAFISAALNGRRRVNRPPHAAQLPPHSSYSYNGIGSSPANIDGRHSAQPVPILFAFLICRNRTSS